MANALEPADIAPEDVVDRAPSLVLVPPGFDAHYLELWQANAIRVVEVPPHGFADVYGAVRAMAAALGVADRGRAFVRSRADPLAVLSTSSHAAVRPVVVPVVSLRPIELAGGHSPLADLVQIAGAETVTHGSDENRLPIDEDELRGMIADVMLVALPRPPDATERALAARLAPRGARVESIVLIERMLWLEPPIEVACEVRGAVVGDRSTVTREACVDAAETAARLLPVGSG